jgi:pimeloyl-ACP methyl ester carboxylesterase
MNTVPLMQSLVGAGIHFLVRPGDPEQTIVLLHGIGGHASGFTAIMQHWPAGPRIFAWDCPGYGLSHPVADERPDPRIYAVALAAALDELGVVKVSIMGQSLGALFAGAFASLFPDRVKDIVLMCPALGYRTGPEDALPEGLAKRIAEHRSEGAAAFASARAPRLVNDPLRKPGVVETVRASMAMIGSSGHAQAVHALAQGDLIKAAASWSHKVLLLAGADDVITPLSGTQHLFSTLRARPRKAGIREQLHIISDAGHAVFLEHPDEVAASAAAFLRGSA